VLHVDVADQVTLEVLDWGGTGRAVVLLAGSGNTAHVFGEFAPKLTDCCHVYGVTRRGYSLSSHPDDGYTEQRLAEDVLRVLDILKISTPVLVGHSMAGEELTRLGAEHSDRLRGLVYLDAPRIRRIIQPAVRSTWCSTVSCRHGYATLRRPRRRPIESRSTHTTPTG
jgi:non-heme chloroperoxidase